MPAFARKYRLTTVPESNAWGDWFGIKFTDLGFVTVPEYKAAAALVDAVERGLRRVEAPIASDADPGPAAA
jgi:hypothetical protein